MARDGLIIGQMVPHTNMQRQMGEPLVPSAASSSALALVVIHILSALCPWFSHHDDNQNRDTLILAHEYVYTFATDTFYMPNRIHKIRVHIEFTQRLLEKCLWNNIFLIQPFNPRIFRQRDSRFVSDWLCAREALSCDYGCRAFRI